VERRASEFLDQRNCRVAETPRQIINWVLESKKIWDYREGETYDNEQNCIRYEIRKGHQPNAAEQRNETLLPLPENKIRQTDRAKNYSQN
jgi:3-mercaptopyruvate sulfurtransferase SseA